MSKKLKHEFNQKKFSLNLENYFILTKFKMIQMLIISGLIISLCIMIFVGLSVFIPDYLNVNNKAILVILVFFLIIFFISLSFLVWAVLLLYQNKKIRKEILSKKEVSIWQKNLFYLLFYWIGKLYFSQETSKEILKDLKKDVLKN